MLCAIVSRSILITNPTRSLRLSILRRHLCSRDNLNTMCPTVGIIIIGDEILKGHVVDTNSHFLSRRLFSLGVKVKKISVIPDDLELIAQEVREFSSTYTHVITAGGIGPTHDDMTFEGVAKAFGEEVQPHPDLVQLCKEFFGTDDLRSPKLKLAHVPKSAFLHYGVDKKSQERSRYPLVAVKNVYVFPGIPSLLERAFNMLEHLFKNPNASFHVREIYVQNHEVSIASVLNEADSKFKENVIIGSYPDLHNSYYKVKLTLESENMEQLNSACDFLNTSLPEGSIVNFEKDPIGNAVEWVYGIVESEEDTPFAKNVRSAVKVIEECFSRYSLDEISVGFNGGKDCTVILHLVYAVVKRRNPDHFTKLKTLYISRGKPFPEVELFIEQSAKSYRLEMFNFHGRIKDRLGDFKEQEPGIKVVVMGTRRSDPYSNHLESFIMTDPDWPQFMRVNPILDWSFEDIWIFIRRLCLPYCSLYDQGYTSLGSMENTHPNPALRVIDDKGSVTYRPAYELADCDSERAGRN